MADIYDILSKHFLHEASEKEEQKVASYKEENPLEYNSLKELWLRDKIDVIEFDTSKAWTKVQAKVKVKKGIIATPLYQKMLRIAAVITLALLAGFGAQYLVNDYQSKQIVMAKVDSGDRLKEIRLDDGSIVWLNGDATLSFPKKFSKKERSVILTGEAFFEVTKNPEKPFIVEMTNSYVQVLGTSFNINTNQEKTVVTVATGKVSVSDLSKENKVIIAPGSLATVRGAEVKKGESENLNYLSWKTGEFTFKNTPTMQVVQDLNTFYTKQIIIEEGATIDCMLTANFKDTNINDVLEILRLTCDIRVVSTPDNYIIK